MFSGGLHHIGDELVLYQKRQGVRNIKGFAVGTCWGLSNGLAQGQLGLQTSQQRHIGGRQGQAQHRVSAAKHRCALGVVDIDGCQQVIALGRILLMGLPQRQHRHGRVDQVQAGVQGKSPSGQIRIGVHRCLQALG